MSWMSDFIHGVFGKDTNSDTSSLSKTNQTVDTTRNPWAAAIPYLTSGLQSGQDIFNQFSSLSPDEQNAAGDQASVLQTRQSSPIYAQAGSDAMHLLSGDSIPTLNTPGAITANTLAPAKAAYTMGASDPVAARGAQGADDPSTALRQILSGKVTDPYLSQVADFSTAEQQKQYGRALADADQSLSQTVLPAIGQGANMAGGYGGSRQGIAQGLALSNRNKELSRQAEDLGISAGQNTANLYGNAYEAAQQRKADTANQLDSRALQAREFDLGNMFKSSEDNANFDQQAQLDDLSRNLTAQQDTAGNTLTGNNQALALAGLTPQVLTSGLNMFNTATGAGDNNFEQLMSVLGLPRNTAESTFADWMQPLTGIAGLGGTSNSTLNSTTQSNTHNNTNAADSAFDIAKMLAALAMG